MTNLKIGVVSLARKTFDYEEARKQYATISEKLKEIEGVDFIFADDLLFEVEDAVKTADYMAHQNPDGLICISGTFHLGHLVLEMVKRIGKPVLLWGLKEPPYDGGKIRLNSVCGVNLDASNLFKAGIKDYHACFGNKLDRDWLSAVRAQSALKQARFGLVGSRAHGFFNLAFDELNYYRETGILLDYYQLTDIFEQPVEAETVTARLNKLRYVFSVNNISMEQLEKVAELAAKIDGFMEVCNLSGLALRCWPEFANQYGIAPCAAMSLLQAEGRLIACEGDVEGLISMYIHKVMGGKTPFLGDLSQVDFLNDEVLLWHCGVAPCNLWDRKCEISLDSYHAGGKGVTADFVLREGAVSVMRVDSAGRDIRLFLAKGKTLPMPKNLRGTYARLKFDGGVNDLMQKIINHGIAHHISMVYDDFTRPLEILAKLKNWQVIK